MHSYPKLTGVFQIYWGVSNILGCFECIVAFRINGGDLSTLLCFECVVIVCGWFTFFEFFRGRTKDGIE